MSRSRAPRLRSLALSGAFIASGVLGGAALAGCGEDTHQEDVYCADKDGKIIDEKYCDDDDNNGGGGFIFIGGFGGGRPVGYQLPPSQRSTSFPYNDRAARTANGLPATGKVTGTGGMGGKVARSGTVGGSGSKASGSKGGGFGGSKGGTSS